MDRIKEFQRRIWVFRQWAKVSKCPRVKAECRLEIAQCHLTIAAIRYGQLLGYGKEGQ